MEEDEEGDFGSWGGGEDLRTPPPPSPAPADLEGDRGGLGGGGRGALAEATATAVEGNTIRGGDAAGPSPKSIPPTVSSRMSLMSGFSGLEEGFDRVGD